MYLMQNDLERNLEWAKTWRESMFLDSLPLANQYRILKPHDSSALDHADLSPLCEINTSGPKVWRTIKKLFKPADLNHAGFQSQYTLMFSRKSSSLVSFGWFLRNVIHYFILHECFDVRTIWQVRSMQSHNKSE